MIISDTLALWIGWIFLITLFLAIFGALLWFVLDKLFQANLEWKALTYAIASNMKKYKDNEGIVSQTSMKVGRKWWVRYKGKDYLWECIKEEEKK